MWTKFLGGSSMKKETVGYPFLDLILFVSKEENGTCLLGEGRVFVWINGEVQKISLNRYYKEAYALNSEKLLLVHHRTCGTLEEMFTFELSIFSLKTKTIEASKKYLLSDFRGIKIKSGQIVVGLNSYDSELLASIDPEGLCYDIPCPEFAEYAEIQRLDFELNELDSTIYDKDLPDDLLMSVSGYGEEELIIFNHHLTSGLDKFVGRIKDKIYGIRQGNQFVCVDRNGMVELLHSSSQKIVGVGISFTESLPVFRLYQQSELDILSPENSLLFILNK
jgi:hypothetical protein